jgi:hypothetical protein
MAPVAMGQVAKGNIYGTVTDESGAVLPGAVATLTGELGTQNTVSDGTGKFRFLNMDHGNYIIRIELVGFVTQEREFILTSDVNVDFSFAMAIAGVEETITVTAETPVVDIKKTGTEQTIQKDELEKIPSSRDPWALLRTVAGVQVDRVNLAGSESGQQSNYQGKGANDDNNTWSIDGINITDMAAVGASPTYYTYDTFDEVNVTTGGSDITAPTGGVHMSFVSKRGTNNYRGTFAFNWADDSLQSSNIPSELEGDPRLKGNDKADHTTNITDWSIDFGGPIIKDKLWAYGQYGKNVPEVKRLNQTTDKTILKNYLAKVNFQATASDNVSWFWFLGAKEKIGRSPGGSLERGEDSLWDQGGLYSKQPHGLTKLEWNRVWSSNLITNTKFAYYSTGFNLGARNDLDEVIDYVNGVYDNAPTSWRYLRPQTTFRMDNSYFLEQGEGSHEIKFGGGYKLVNNESSSYTAGNKTKAYFMTSGIDEARFYREAYSGTKATYLSLYVGDTYTRGRMNLNVGLRYDHQVGSNKAAEVAGNPMIPELLPGLSYAGGGEGITWNNLSPRVAFTYALDESYKTVLRASFARYHDQLPVGRAGQDNPLGGQAYLTYRWQDLNNDRFIQLDEVDFSDLRGFGGVDPNDPGAIDESVDKIDPDYSAGIDYEMVFGVDREIVRDLGVGVAFSYRQSGNFTWYPDIGVTTSDYYQGDPVTTDGYTSIPWILNDGVLDRAEVTGGDLLTNQDGYNRKYWGLELTMNKRLSNNWMSRLSFGYNDQKEYYDGGAGIQNPSFFDTSPTGQDGQPVIRLGGGSGKSIYFTYGWTFNWSALYQLPYGFDIAGNFFTRQGYPLPYYHRINLGAFEGTTEVVGVQSVEDENLPRLVNVDIRFAKNFSFAGGRNATLAFEVFNLFNANTELARYINLGSSSFNRLDEILAPRIARIVARVRF